MGPWAPSTRYASVVPESTTVPCEFDVANKEESMGRFRPLTEILSRFKL
jgi:hypothetical protein